MLFLFIDFFFQFEHIFIYFLFVAFVVHLAIAASHTSPPPSLRVLLYELHSVRDSWYNIGLQLCIPPAELDCIRHEHGNSLHLLLEMLRKWLHTTVNPPTWEAVVAALRSPAVNKKHVAEQLESKYCKGVLSKLLQALLKKAQTWYLSILIMLFLFIYFFFQFEHIFIYFLFVPFVVHLAIAASHTSPPPSERSQNPPFGCGCGKCTFFGFIEKGCPTPIPSASSFPYLNISGLTQWQQQELRGRLWSESQEIMIKFQRLVSATIKSFQERCVPLDDLVSHVMGLGAFDPMFKESQVPVFHHRFEELKAADTIAKVFMVLNNHFSFFNYHILENLIEKLGTEKDKERLKTYKEHFNKYAKRRIFECPSEFGTVSDVGYADIIVKLDVEHEKFTVAEIELFCHKLSEIVHISSQGVLCLCQVDKGCIELTFQVPSFVQQKIFPLSREQEIALEEEGVIKLKCGKYHFSSKKHGRLHVAT